MVFKAIWEEMQGPVHAVESTGSLHAETAGSERADSAGMAPVESAVPHWEEVVAAVCDVRTADSSHSVDVHGWLPS